MLSATLHLLHSGRYYDTGRSRGAHTSVSRCSQSQPRARPVAADRWRPPAAVRRRAESRRHVQPGVGGERRAGHDDRLPWGDGRGGRAEVMGGVQGGGRWGSGGRGEGAVHLRLVRLSARLPGHALRDPHWWVAHTDTQLSTIIISSFRNDTPTDRTQ